MTAVTDSLAGVFTGQQAPRVSASATALVDALVDMHGLPGPEAFWALAPLCRNASAHPAGALLLAGALAIAPARAASAARLFRMPEYSALASGATEIAALGQPMQSIDSAFDLPPGCNAEFLYIVIGGRLDSHAPWRAIIRRDGRVEYVRAGASGP
jgi:hypothetical protein